MTKVAWAIWGAGALAISLALAALDGLGAGAPAWIGYLIALGGSAVLLAAGWRVLRSLSPPGWLLGLTVGAFLLRLGVGVALARALPVYGYDEKNQNQGYLYPDAFTRDQDAIALARADKPLWTALTDPRASDQYGGLLFLSAASYRYFTPEGHYPLMLVVFCAAFSSLAVLFAWGFASLAFGAGAAALASGVLAFYPEAILLGASQMREPFILAGSALAFFGYARRRSGEARGAWAAIALGAALALFFSPPFGLLLLVILAGAALWEGRVDLGRRPWVVIGLALLGVVGVALVANTWARLFVGNDSTLVDVVRRWFTEGTSFELYKLGQASGWADKIFALTPEWMHAPLAAVNGLVQPFLPAALLDWTGLPLFRGLITFRAAGWFFLLPFLLYAPPAIWRAEGPRSLGFYLAVVVWIGAFLIAYRTAGDQWDNPRYRVFLLLFQSALAGWAWVHARRTGSPWLFRTAVVVAFATLAFLQWYAVRYYHLPGLDLWGTLGLIAVFIPVYVAVMWRLDRRPDRAALHLEGR